MAIQFTDFSRAPLLENDSPLKTIFEDVLKGYKMSQEPAKMKEEQSARELANKLKGLEVEHKPKEYALADQEKNLANALKSKALSYSDEKFDLERQYKKAQIENLLNKKVGGNTRANGELANFIVANPDATQQEISDAYKEIHERKVRHEKAITGRSEDITAGAPYDKLPVNEKKRQVGLMTAMGVDPLEANKLLRSGTSPTEYADQKDIDISSVTPVYPLGEENVKQLQRRRGFVNELKTLENRVAEPLSRYPAKIRGYSIEQIADSLDNKNPDEMGKVLAARALSPEISALRLKVAGGNIGIEAINELQNKSMTNMNIIEGLVDQKTYLAAQKYMTKWLEEAADTFETTLEDYGKLKGKGKSLSEGKTYNLATRSWE